MGGILTASRVLFVDSLAFRCIFFVTLAATVLAALARIIPTSSQGGGGGSTASTAPPAQLATATTPPPPKTPMIDGNDTLENALEVKHLFVLVEKRDFAKVLPLAQTLIKRNNPEGMLVLGELFEYGLGVKQDLAAARVQYTAASKMGEPDAVLHLARMLEQGQGGAADRNTAINLFLFAARNQADGAEADIKRLNLVNDRGITVEQAYDDLILNRDPANAGRVMEGLVKDGASPALCFVGMLYLYGKAVPQDGAKAAEFFAAGAKRDYPWCEWGMAKLTYGGAVNLPKNLVHAHVWYQLAVYTDMLGKNKPAAQQELAALEQQMQPQDLANARTIYQRAVTP
jgi:uncharacterized protein